ncbi:MAG: hypothetical protein AAF846_03940 [Chloroflexota bacterium]
MQIQIMYSGADAHHAQSIQNDIATASLRVENKMVILVLTPRATQDNDLKQDVQNAKNDNIIVPVILEQTTVPDYLRGFDTLDLSKKYNETKLINFINRADVTAERRTNNRRLLWVVGGIAMVMFVISLVSIGSGVVAFPVDEYATENAIRDAQVATIVAPQIEELRPRTTEDALNFEMTLEAVRNDDLIPFIEGTATAIPLQRSATEQARQTQIAATQSASD